MISGWWLVVGGQELGRTLEVQNEPFQIIGDKRSFQKYSTLGIVHKF
jgi:hypothetical protein